MTAGSSGTADGGCRGNPGPGGWGAWLKAGEAERELFGGEKLTTNNRMELTAVIEALGLVRARHPDALHLAGRHSQRVFCR